MLKSVARLTVAALALSFAPVTHAACEYPARVDLPNGLTAEKTDMLEAQKAVQAYVASMEAYLDCIVLDEKTARSEMDNLDPEVEQQREDLLNKKYNAAISEMETLAARFNSEVQAYRERNE